MSRSVLFAAVLVGAAFASIPASAGGHCDIAVEGAVTATGRSKGGNSELTSDYWFNPDELAQAVRIMTGMVGSKNDDQAKKDQRVADALKRDPKIATFIFNCMADDITVNFLPNGTYADVPFGAKKYTIAKGSPSRARLRCSRAFAARATS